MKKMKFHYNNQYEIIMSKKLKRDIDQCKYVTATILEAIDTLDLLRKMGYEIVEHIYDNRYLLRRIPVDAQSSTDMVKLENIEAFSPTCDFDLTRYKIYDIGLHDNVDVNQFAGELTKLGAKVKYAKRSKIRAKLTEETRSLVYDGERVHYLCPYIEPRLA